MTKVFIIHGWTYNLDKWQKLLPELSKRSLEPVMLRVPGLTKPNNAVWDIHDYINWLDGSLVNEANPIVIGHSNGGRIALSYIQQHPGKLKQLILIDSAGIAHQQTTKRTKLFVLKIVSKIGKLLSFLPPVKKLFYRVIGAQDYLNAPPNMRKTMQNMLKADQAIDLSAIKLPVTIIWGRDDTITPFSDAQELEHGIQGAKLVVIDNARHAPMDTHPNQVAEAIEQAVKDQA